MNLRINPATNDLEEEGDWFAEDATAAAMVHCQLMHHQKAWVGDPQAGSTIAELMKSIGDGPAGQQAVLLETRRALTALEEARLIAGVDVTLLRDGIGRFRIDTRYHDRATRRVIVTQSPAM